MNAVDTNILIYVNDPRDPGFVSSYWSPMSLAVSVPRMRSHYCSAKSFSSIGSRKVRHTVHIVVVGGAVPPSRLIDEILDVEFQTSLLSK